MTLRAPYTTTLYAPGLSDAVWVWNRNVLVALLSPANALRFYGPLEEGIFA